MLPPSGLRRPADLDPVLPGHSHSKPNGGITFGYIELTVDLSVCSESGAAGEQKRVGAAGYAECRIDEPSPYW